jgi:pilus assembly protein Flp/PilA
MTKIKNAIRRFTNKEDGATAVEYGLLAALIAVVIIVGVTALGVNLGAMFNTIAGSF